MAHAPAVSRTIERVSLAGGAARAAASDDVAVEAPLELRAGGEPFLMMMRTPGHDEDLARGLLYAEGVISSAGELALERPDGLVAGEHGNVLETGLTMADVRERLPERSLYVSSSCGVCGKSSIAAIEQRQVQPLRSTVAVAAGVVSGLPEALLAAQATFAQTGGLHAAGLFDATGALIQLREDVGRHNAVDKVVGWALAEGQVPADELVLCVSGRLSFEIVQKAVLAHIPVIVAVSAPSSLAIDLAERFVVTLCGFTRDQRFNLYSHGSRIL